MAPFFVSTCPGEFELSRAMPGEFDERRRRRREGRRRQPAVPSVARDERAKPASNLGGRAN